MIAMESSLLLKFVPEVLNLILSYVSSVSVLALWKCGSRQLNYRLSRGGATSISLEDDFLYTFSKWPRMLRDLKHLQSLSLRALYISLGPSELILREIFSLPRNLVRLELDFRGAGAWLNIPTETSSLFDESRISQPPDTPYYSIIDLDAVFPTLKELSLLEHSNFAASWTTHDLTRLPRQLVCLTLKLGQSCWSDLSNLPSGLELLNLGGTTLLESAISTLPSSLTSLHAYLSPSWDLFSHALPAGLKFFPVDSSDAHSIRWPLHTSSISQLSATVLPEVMKQTPFLRHLTLSFRTAIPSSSLLILPSSITHLRVLVSPSDWNSISANMWPKSLQTLVLQNVDSNHLHRLPRNITVLTCSLIIFKPLYMEEQNFISSSLGESSSEELPGDAEGSPDRLLGLPHSLRSLRIFETLLEAVSDPFIALPPNLSLLEVPPTVLKASSFLLPQGLHYLSVSSGSAIDQSLLFKSILTCLHTLIIHDFDSAMLLCLPRSLTHLTVYDSRETRKKPQIVSIDRLKSLPPDLENLHWTDLECSSSTFFTVLPRQIRNLQLPKATSLGADIINLPRHLERLRIGEINDIHEADLRALPSSLHSIYGTFKASSEQDILLTHESTHLPPLFDPSASGLEGSAFAHLLRQRRSAISRFRNAHWH